MPRHLQSKIHSDFSKASGVWDTYKSEVISLWANGPANKADFNDHLIREFNRKVIHLGFNNLSFSPYDAGFRFLGSGVAPAETYTYVYASGQQVFTNDGQAVYVPDQYANA